MVASRRCLLKLLIGKLVHAMTELQSKMKRKAGCSSYAAFVRSVRMSKSFSGNRSSAMEDFVIYAFRHGTTSVRGGALEGESCWRPR